MDRGADARVADAEPPFEQRLRAEGADQRDLHGGGHDSPDAEATREGSMNLTKHVQRDAPCLGGWDNAYGRALHRRQRSVGERTRGRSKNMSSTTPASEGFVPFREFRVRYRIVGELDQPAPGRFPLLVLHGGPGAPHDYLDPLAALAQSGRPVVFYDQLGSGNSDQPDDPTLWNIDLYLDEVDTVRRELGLDRVHLLGQSWGGMLALSYALMQPAGFLSLVVADSTASMPLHAA